MQTYVCERHRNEIELIEIESPQKFPLLLEITLMHKLMQWLANAHETSIDHLARRKTAAVKLND